MAENEQGVLIDQGPQSWAILQQGSKGTADFALSGRWRSTNPSKVATVLVRVLDEDYLQAVSQALDWTAARTEADGTWAAEIRGLPRGGLYRVETTLQFDGGPVEWAQRGDMIHHLGVGDVWVIAGQSNAAGYGKMPAWDPPELGVHLFHARGQWCLAAHPLGDSTGTRYPANRESANASHSPWLTFARKLRHVLGYPIGLIPASLGGSPLSAWCRGVDGVLFENMLRYLRDSGGGCRGMVWYQGCSDTGPRERAVYLERFQGFVEDLRRTLAEPAFPVLTVQLNRYVGEPYGSAVHEGWDAIREIQRQAARQIRNVAVISALDLGLSDGIHNHSSANLVIGERVADSALGVAYGRDVKHLCPDLKAAQMAGETAVELVFENIGTRLHFENNIPEQLPFRVRDGAGLAPITGWKLTARDTLRLELGRGVSGKVQVTGAPTACPPYMVPFDIAGYRPMLAFDVEVRVGGTATS